MKAGSRIAYRWNIESTGTIAIYNFEPGQSKVVWDSERPWGPRPEWIDTYALVDLKKFDGN